jgi:hypothetical protein
MLVSKTERREGAMKADPRIAPRPRLGLLQARALTSPPENSPRIHHTIFLGHFVITRRRVFFSVLKDFKLCRNLQAVFRVQWRSLASKRLLRRRRARF